MSAVTRVLVGAWASIQTAVGIVLGVLIVGTFIWFVRLLLG